MSDQAAPPVDLHAYVRRKLLEQEGLTAEPPERTFPVLQTGLIAIVEDEQLTAAGVDAEALRAMLVAFGRYDQDTRITIVLALSDGRTGPRAVLWHGPHDGEGARS